MAELRNYRVSLSVELDVRVYSHEQAGEEAEMVLLDALKDLGYTGRLVVRPTGTTWLDAPA